MKRFWMILLLAAGLIGGAAQAAEMTLPASLRCIEAGAFERNAAMQAVEIPDAVVEIGEGAFRDCAALGRVSVGANVESIGEGAFENCAGDILICAPKGSTAALYAARNGMDYQADTVYRALLIGNSYAWSRDLRLNGPENDASAMKRCLFRFSVTPYEVYTRMDQTVEGMLESIENVFGGAEAEDVSLLYYSGHGTILDGDAPHSALLGNDGSGTLTAEALRRAMDAIPGRKIIVIDACYSGGFIDVGEAQPNSASGNGAASFAEGFVSEFVRMRKRSAGGDSYFILTSASADEESYEQQLGGRSIGRFTGAFVEGCGWDAAGSVSGSLLADENDNGAITLDEIYRYTGDKLTDAQQHVQVWPQDCGWFGLLRD